MINAIAIPLFAFVLASGAHYWFHPEYFNTPQAFGIRLIWAISEFAFATTLTLSILIVRQLYLRGYKFTRANPRQLDFGRGCYFEKPLRMAILPVTHVIAGIWFLRGNFNYGIWVIELSKILLMLTWCWGSSRRRWIYARIFTSALFAASFLTTSFGLVLASYTILTLSYYLPKGSLEARLEVRNGEETILKEAKEESVKSPANFYPLQCMIVFQKWDAAYVELEKLSRTPGCKTENREELKAKVDAETGNVQESIKSHQRSEVKRKSKYLGFLALAYAKAGKAEEALKTAEELAGMKLDFARNTYRSQALAGVYCELGDVENAIKWGERWFQIGFNHFSYRALARSYYKIGKLREARYLLSQFVEKIDYFPKKELEELAKISAEMNDAKAADYYERLSKLEV